MMQPNTITPGRSLTRPKIEELGRWYLEAEDIANTPKGQAMAKEQAARIQREFQRLVKRVSVEFTERDPYPNVEAMRQDIESNKRMFVYTLFSETPLWTEKVNWMARAVHDWDHYVSGADFTMQGEIDAYRYTAARSPALAELYLSEIALQAAANNIIGQFPSGAQKLVAASERILAVGSMLKNPALAPAIALAAMLSTVMEEREVMVHLAAKGVSLEDGTLVMTAARILEQMEHPMTQQMAANAHWSSSYVNSLPNSAFLLVKGNERKFPYRNKAGHVDKHHLANALARLAQENTDVTQAERKRLTDKGHAIYEQTFGYAANAGYGPADAAAPWHWWAFRYAGAWRYVEGPREGAFHRAVTWAHEFGDADDVQGVTLSFREATPDEIEHEQEARRKKMARLHAKNAMEPNAGDVHKGHAIYEHEFGYAANASAGAPGKRRRSGSGGPPWEHEGKPERWWIWEWTNGDWHTTPAPTRELALQEARAYGAANGATVVESTMRETTPDEIGDLAEGITVWTSGYATNGDNMESNARRGRPSAGGKMAYAKPGDRMVHGWTDYTWTSVPLGQLRLIAENDWKPYKHTGSDPWPLGEPEYFGSEGNFDYFVTGVRPDEPTRMVFRQHAYAKTFNDNASPPPPPPRPHHADTQRRMRRLVEEEERPFEPGRDYGRGTQEHHFAVNSEDPFKPGDPRHGRGLRSRASTRDAIPLTEEQADGAWHAGYEGASLLHSKGKSIERDDVLLWVSKNDRRVPTGLSEDDLSFWEWLQAVADGAEAFKTGLPQERHFAVNADTFWVDATGRDGFQFLDRATVPLVSGTPLPLHSWSPLSPAQRNALERVRSEVLSEYLAAIEAEDEMGKEMRDAHRRPTADFSRGEYADLVETVRLLENAILSEIGY